MEKKAFDIQTFKPKYVLENGNDYIPLKPTVYYKVRVSDIATKGKGVFAQEYIAKGATVGICGGQVIYSDKDFPPEAGDYGTIQDENSFIVPHNYAQKPPFWFLNHSCGPNLRRIGIVFIAKKNISKGEELTVHYSPLCATLDDYSLECKCGDSDCRKIITGNDWKDPVLAKKLWVEWLPFIQKKIITMKIIP